MTEKIAVVGSGLGGLAAAATLAARGHQVTVLEKNSWLGGKAAQLEQDGFRFDMGPTILTVPSVLFRIFAEAQKDIKDYLDLVRLDPQWRCFYEDGSVLDLQEDVEKMSAVIRDYSPNPEDGERYGRFVELSEKLNEISQKYFFWRSVGGVADTLNVKEILKPWVLKDLIDMRMGKSVSETIRANMKDERVAQMLDHFTQYVGSSPEASPAVLCGIAHMQVDEGVWYPMGGTRAVPEALVQLGQDLGVDYRTEVEVTDIRTHGGQVQGVIDSAGRFEAFDTVVSNSDAIRTYRELVGGRAGQDAKLSSFEPACSGVVLYLGLKERYPHLAHHNFVFSRDPEEEFEAIYDQGQPAPDPTAYVCAPAVTEPGVAPEGGDALYVLVHTPYLRKDHNWEKMLPEYRKVILEKLRRTAGLEDIEDRIVTESHLTPQSIHDRYRVLNGAIYGVASHGRWFGAFKPANRSRKVGGLYLAGGAAHPGPGMPMVMMSGWIAADCVDQDKKGGQTRPPAKAA
ncbi:MAG: phytoene desaturase family protein [Verrucomicrobiota bacterium]